MLNESQASAVQRFVLKTWKYEIVPIIAAFVFFKFVFWLFSLSQIAVFEYLLRLPSAMDICSVKTCDSYDYDTRASYLLVLLLIEIMTIVRLSCMALVLASARYNHIGRWFGSDVIDRLRQRTGSFGIWESMVVLAIIAFTYFALVFNIKFEIQTGPLASMIEEFPAQFYGIMLFFASWIFFMLSVLIFSLCEIALNYFGTWPFGRLWKE